MLLYLLFRHLADLLFPYGPPYDGHHFTNHPVIPDPNPLADLSTIPNCFQMHPSFVCLHQSIVFLSLSKECKSFSSHGLSDGLLVLRFLLLPRLAIICCYGANTGIIPLEESLVHIAIDPRLGPIG